MLRREHFSKMKWQGAVLYNMPSIIMFAAAIAIAIKLIFFGLQ